MKPLQREANPDQESFGCDVTRCITPISPNGYRMIPLTFEGNKAIDIHLSSPWTSGSRTMLRECLKQLDVADSSLSWRQTKRWSLSKEASIHISTIQLLLRVWHLDSRCDKVYYIKVQQPNSMNFLGTTFSLSWCLTGRTKKRSHGSIIS